MKKWIFIILLLSLIISSFDIVFAQKTLEIYFFYSLTCPHCAKEKAFLEKLEEKYPEIEIKKFPLSERKNIELLKEFYQKYKVPQRIQGFVPISFIRERYFLGFSEKIGQEIEHYILQFIKEASPEEKPLEEEFSEPTEEIVSPTPLEKKIEIPFIGKINPERFSLPVLAMILGFFDGFNVCSLGALVLILGIVLALKSRSKILVLGGVFILTTGIIYGSLIILWHKIFILLSPYLREMEILIGTLAVFGGIHFFREFLKSKKRGPVCKFGGISENLSQRVQEAFEKKLGIIALTGVVFSFAAIITIVEFPCSAVLPVIFAGILTEAKTSTLLSLLYIGIFLIFYLLDEILVFLISLLTLRLWIASPKFVNFLNLAASIILFFLGIYYLAGLA